MLKTQNKITNNFIIFTGKILLSSEDFDVSKLILTELVNENFETFVKFSVDGKNIVEEKPEGVDSEIVIEGLIIESQNNINKLTIDSNINNLLGIYTFDCITYDGVDSPDYKVIVFENIINESPKWNFYDNQQVTLNRWKKQIISINSMYGHLMTYFKTEAVKTNHTLQNNYIKDVVDIKKIIITVPQNLIPTDINIYSEWDFPMQDEYYFDIIDSVFKQAFGETKIPQKDDVIYFPLINKFMRVTSTQPKNGFMGYIGWWKVFIANYADDESVNFNDDMKQAIEGTEFELEFQNFADDNVISADKILQNTIGEKNEATEAFSNKPIDSVSYIDLKETEAIRNYYHKRLDIVSLNPEKNSFPVTMYDCNKIRKRIIALTYNLTGNITKNKLKLDVVNNCVFQLNIAIKSSFIGEIFDLIHENGTIIFTLSLSGLNLKYNFAGEVTKTEITTLKEFEYYEIYFKFNKGGVLLINVSQLINGVKSLIFTNEFEKQNNEIDNLTFINIYGGKYFFNDTIVHIDNNKIFQDYCNPILNK